MSAKFLHYKVTLCWSGEGEERFAMYASIFCFSSYFYLPILPSLDDSNIQRLLLWYFFKWWLSTSIIPFIFINCKSTVRSSFPPPFIYLSNCWLSLWTGGDLFYSMSYNLLLSLYILLLKLSQILDLPFFFIARIQQAGICTRPSSSYYKLLQCYLLFLHSP